MISEQDQILAKIPLYIEVVCGESSCGVPIEFVGFRNVNTTDAGFLMDSSKWRLENGTCRNGYSPARTAVGYRISLV